MYSIEWVHIIISHEDGAFDVYLDGKLITTKLINPPPSNMNGKDIYITSKNELLAKQYFNSTLESNYP